MLIILGCPKSLEARRQLILIAWWILKYLLNLLFKHSHSCAQRKRSLYPHTWISPEMWVDIYIYYKWVHIIWGHLYANFRGRFPRPSYMNIFSYLCIKNLWWRWITWSGVQRFGAASGYSINIFNWKLIPANGYAFGLRTPFMGNYISMDFVHI